MKKLFSLLIVAIMAIGMVFADEFFLTLLQKQMYLEPVMIGLQMQKL